MRGASRARRDEGLMAVELESNPSERSLQQPRAGIVDVQCVDAAQIDGDGRWRIAQEAARRRPDLRVNRAAIECQPLRAGARFDRAQPRIWIYFHFSGGAVADGGARIPIGLER